MDYLMIAYGLIGVVLIGYALSIVQRMRVIQRDRVLFESKDK